MFVKLQKNERKSTGPPRQKFKVETNWNFLFEAYNRFLGLTVLREQQTND
jgi:hypothetical protein